MPEDTVTRTLPKWTRGGTKALNGGVARAGMGPHPAWDSWEVQRLIQGPFPRMDKPVKPKTLSGQSPNVDPMLTTRHSVGVKEASLKVANPIGKVVGEVLAKTPKYVMDGLKSVPKKDLVLVPAGVIGGHYLTEAESKKFELSPTGHEALGWLNLALGGVLGSSKGRQQLLKRPIRQKGVTTGHEYDFKKVLGTGSLAALKTMGVPLGDSLIDASKSSKDVTENFKGTMSDISSSVNQVLGDITKSITGREPGRTPIQQDTENFARKILSSAFPRTPGGPPPPQDAEILQTWENAKNRYIEQYPEYSDKIETAFNNAKGDAVKLIREWNPIDAKSSNDQGVSKLLRGLEKTVGNIDLSSSNLKDMIGGAKDMGDSLTEATQNITESSDKIVETISPFSDIGKKLQDPRVWKTIGAVGLGAGASLGAYNLLRDYLNYRRISREKERERSFRKGASVKTGGRLGQQIWGSVLGGLTSGGTSYVTSQAAGMSPGESAVWASLLGGLGAIGGGSIVSGAHKKIDASRMPGQTPINKSRALAESLYDHKGMLMATVASDLAGGTVMQNLRSKTKLNQAQRDQLVNPPGTGPMDVAKAIGLGGLGLAGIYALIQGARAAKSVSEGNPLVDVSSETKNNIFSGASGGPENPNVGGKVYVTLPTKNPDDKETVVELPLENVPLPNAVINKVKRDTKRRLRTETAARTIPQSVSTPGRIRELMAVNRPVQ